MFLIQTIYLFNRFGLEKLEQLSEWSQTFVGGHAEHMQNQLQLPLVQEPGGLFEDMLQAGHRKGADREVVVTNE